jgi:transposase
MHVAHLSAGDYRWQTGLMRKRYTDELRAQLVTEVRTTGEKVPIVAARMGVGTLAAYQWMKDAALAEKAPVFARVLPAREVKSSWLVVEVGQATVRVERGFDVARLRQVVSALS